MTCPICKNEMENLGNVENKVYLSHPVQWDDLWVCRTCKCKTKERKYGKLTELPKDFNDFTPF